MKIRTLPSVSLAPVLTVSPVQAGNAASPVNGTFEDVEVLVSSGVSTWDNFNISADAGVEIENLTPAALDFTEYPLVKRITGTLGTVRVKKNRVSKTVDLNLNFKPSATLRTITAFRSGSVAEKSWSLLRPKLEQGKPKNLFSSYNHSQGVYAFNPDCWASSWNWTGVAVWNSRMKDGRMAGTAITRRHLWFSWHFRPNVGDIFKFTRQDGTTISRTVVGINSGSNYLGAAYHENPALFDICVAVLDSDLPEGIASYPVAGPWFRVLITSPSSDKPSLVAAQNNTSVYTPDSSTTAMTHAVMRLNQGRSVSVTASAYAQTLALWTINSQVYGDTTLPCRSPFVFTGQAQRLPDFLSAYNGYFDLPVGGDSGSPALVPLSGTTMAVAFLAMTPTSGCFSYEDALNACIRSSDASAGVNTGYVVTVAEPPV